MSLSDEHPVNGDYCIKAIRISPETSNIYLTVTIDVTGYQGKTIRIGADVLNTSNASISLQLNDSFSNGYVAIPNSSSMGTYSCTLQLDENATEVTGIISINGNVTNEEPIFTDNWKLSIQ